MPTMALNAYFKQPLTISARVWFEGSTALSEGQGVCYNYDYNRSGGSSASAYPERMHMVEMPTITNARYFAGVAARDYAANTGGQAIEIFLPGSTCYILSKASTTLGSGILTCEAGGTYAGYFRYAGFQGTGSCVPLQTVDRSNTAGKCLAYLQPGLPSGLLEVVDVTTGGAKTCMVGGVTVINQSSTLAAHATFTVADGTIAGIRKKFVCIADLGDSYDFVATINGIQLDGGTALATAVLDDINDEITIEWDGDWYEKGRVGTSVT